MAAVDYFLKLDGIQGESSDAKHANQIELASFSWGAANSATVGRAGGGAGAGRATSKHLLFVQRTQKSSPALLKTLASGKHIPSGLLTARKSGKDQAEFLKIKLTDVLVTSFDLRADDDALPLEEVGLSFGKIEFTYTPQQATGSAGTPVTTSWDITKNTVT